MKLLLSSFMLLLAVNCMGQSQRLMNKISLEVNQELEGSTFTNSGYCFWFEIQEDYSLLYSITEIQKAPFTKILSVYLDSLKIGQQYRITLAPDPYSSKVYTYMEKVDIQPGLFPHYTNYLSKPEVGKFQFLHCMYTELEKHQDAVNRLTKDGWQDPISVHIDSTGQHKVIKPHPLVKYLDSSLQIPWTLPLYHGKTINAIAEIRLDKAFFNLDDRHSARLHRDAIQVSFILPTPYQNKWVRFSKVKPQYPGDVMVSFVFNPITQNVENPIVSHGDSRKATQLIEWLKALDLSSDLFYWSSLPIAKRTYFFTDASSD